MSTRDHDKIENQLSKCEGFTIIEISIVMVIIALIVAGTFSATNLIRISRLKSVISESQTFQAAANSFKQQYANWPGDITNATTIWSSGSTSNGNGNGTIDYSTSVVTGNAAAATSESMVFWQHLSLSGILTTNYVSSMSGSYASIGTNIPASNYLSLDKQGIVGWGVMGKYLYLGGLTLSNIWTNPCGITSTSTTSCYINSAVPGSDAISPRDAYYIDQKIDDGYPSSGAVLSMQGSVDNSYSASATECLNGTSYNFSNQARGCLMSFYYQ